MKVICHIDDDVSSPDMIYVARAISYLRNNQPEGLGELIYGDSKTMVSYIKNKNSYSIWARRKDES